MARPEGREGVLELARSFSLDQLRVMRNPDSADPIGLAGLGKDNRQWLAGAFRTGPVPEREDTVPDPRMADDVLVLSCAVSERVDSASPLHRSTLPQDIEAVMRSSELARDIPEAEVDELAFDIALKRAETDLRVAAARAVDEGEIFEVRARFLGNPDYSAQQDIDTYKATVAMGMRRLHREEPLPTKIEVRVAHAVVATHGTDRHELALAMAEALERGTTATADDIRKERETLFGHLQVGTKRLDSLEERALLRRVYGSFTGTEIREICEGRGRFLERLADGAVRAKVQEEMLRLHRDTMYPEPSPWRAQHDAVARAAGLVRGHGRERGLGAEIEM